MTFQCAFGSYPVVGIGKLMISVIDVWDLKAGSEEGKNSRYIYGALEKLVEVTSHI